MINIQRKINGMRENRVLTLCDLMRTSINRTYRNFMQLFDFDKMTVCSNLRKAFTQQEGSMNDTKIKCNYLI
jgi:hypothetical protein